MSKHKKRQRPVAAHLARLEHFEREAARLLLSKKGKMAWKEKRGPSRPTRNHNHRGLR